MDDKEILKAIHGYLTIEQEFQHKRVMDGCNKLGKEELTEIVDIVHTNYLVKTEMFRKLVAYCIANGYNLPPMSTLFDKREA
tara:strand:+ start:1805 stop:2050 length:246 start_codon:yes stop_codon:yes gene_type:complete